MGAVNLRPLDSSVCSFAGFFDGAHLNPLSLHTKNNRNEQERFRDVTVKKFNDEWNPRVIQIVKEEIENNPELVQETMVGANAMHSAVALANLMAG